ncbi:MupG family TIM beta-alpha barrel fold protein [Anaerocolumna sp. MB42-C2]|uniref:MupG family TIM beta-alpha barrel fold protein n=1 Tax=Anaerocolumna sp. MB42-C2 TaxID=3070997 RepID=UPI0027DFC852|nr:MupG family TIM beta-alpha barrel fold protein [Anaerocolumna sp. MB42-C2]WMJ86417.1 MupG family TIM beta-alpha barrel fold protein [Anaerocolumna sp. MB42-C2]
MKIGISIYLGTDLDKNIEILKKAKAAGITYAFTSLQIPEESVVDYEKETKKLLEKCIEYGIRLVADASPETVKKLSCNTIEELANWGITSMRLDYGYSPKEIVKLSKSFKIVLNASTITAEDIQDWKNAKADLSKFIACHNYYPKEYTGLSIQRVREINEYLKMEGFQTMAFVPGNKTMRGPLFAGLPTVEEHRFRKDDIVLNMLELYFDAKCDMVMVGDVDVSEKAWENIEMLNQNMIEMKVVLDKKYHFISSVIHHDRIDSSCFIFRSVQSRMSKNRIQPENCIERKKGSICISNNKYLRYEGEVEIARQDLPQDERVNVIGHVDSAYLKYLPYIKHGMGIKLNNELMKGVLL